MKINKLPQRFTQQLGAGAAMNLKPFPKQNAADPGPADGIIPGRTPRPPNILTKPSKVVNPRTHAGKLFSS